MAGPKVPTPEEVEYMQKHANESMIPDVLASCIILSVAATIIVVLRLVSRRLLYRRLKLHLNDWLVVLALLLYIPFVVSFSLSTRYGAGKHVIFATDVRLLQIYNLVNENIYAVVLVLLKWSVIVLYRQLFGSARIIWFDRATFVVAAVVTALGLQVLITSNLQCIPISATWDLNVHGRCIEYGTSATVAYAVNAATELTLLIMPIPLVKQLQVSKQKRWMLYLVFSTGAGTCLISLLQLKYIRVLGQTADPTWDDIPTGLLANVEMCFGMLSSSIPTYRPLYQYLFDNSPASHVPSINSRSIRRPVMYSGSNRIGSSGSNSGFGANVYSMNVSSRADNDDVHPLQTMGRGIVVTDQVELVRHNKVGGVWVRED